MWWKKLTHLDVKNNTLYIAGFQAEVLAKEFGTPVYIYNGDRIIENFKVLKETFFSQKTKPRIHFAMKANSHLAILQLLQKQGAFIDAVSPNEVEIALKAGFPKEKILFTGTSVSNKDLERLLKAGVVINIDSFSQLRRMKELGFKGKASIRWNPGVGAGSHSHTITAGKFIKFGIPEHQIESAFKQAKVLGINIVGLHQHIGSGWLGKDVNTFLETVDKTIAVAEKAEEILGKNLEFVDFGGGPGIRYRKEQSVFPLEKYAKGIAEKMKASKLNAEIAIEPGRSIVGDAGIFLCEVNTVEEKNIPLAGVNAGFNDFIRPAFYGSYHEIVNCNNVNGRNTEEYLIAGNLCESSDVFNENKQALRELPVLKEGHILAILNAGAYGFEMGSNYNSRGLPACVLLLGSKSYLIRERQSLSDVLAKQKGL